MRSNVVGRQHSGGDSDQRAAVGRGSPTAGVRAVLNSGAMYGSPARCIVVSMGVESGSSARRFEIGSLRSA